MPNKNPRFAEDKGLRGAWGGKRVEREWEGVWGGGVLGIGHTINNT
jgi:hypothetical protein